jgi:hypothetical protein
MFDDDKFDELLHRAGRENKNENLPSGPDFLKIEKAAVSACQKKSSKNKSRVVFRVAAACVAAVIILNACLLFADIQPVRAYQEVVKKFVFNILSSKTNDSIETQDYKASNEIQKVQKLVPYRIPAPGWIPAGYAFADVQMRNDGNDVYSVTIKYKSGADILSASISNDSSMSSTMPSGDEEEYEKVSINGNDVYLLVVSVEGSIRSKCFFYSKQGLNIYISGSIDKQSLIHVVESMN